MSTTLELEYGGRKIQYNSPLGIYLDGKITGRTHDAIIPKYNKISAEKLVILNKDEIRSIRNDATRQLKSISLQDKPEVRQALRNTLDLTNYLLQ